MKRKSASPVKLSYKNKNGHSHQSTPNIKKLNLGSRNIVTNSQYECQDYMPSFFLEYSNLHSAYL
jgi:hypothetical protein